MAPEITHKSYSESLRISEREAILSAEDNEGIKEITLILENPWTDKEAEETSWLVTRNIARG